MTSSPRRLSARVAATSLATVWRLHSSTVRRAPGAPPCSGPTSFHSAPSPSGSVTGGPSPSAPTSLGSDINTIMASQDPLPKRDNHTPSCAVCQRRKVKCNRVFPCGPCTKTGLQCEFKPVGEPQGRKRVKRSHDAGDEGDPVAEGGTPRARLSPPQRESDSAGGGASPEVFRGVRGEGGYPYWNAVPTGEALAVSDSTAVRDFRHYRPSNAPAVSDTRDDTGSLDPAIAGPSDGKTARAEGHFLFKQTQTQAVQPPANQIVQLWQTYLSNVDPILKIVHAPTLQQTILGQIGKPALPPNLQALTSAIYFVSVVSLQDEECGTLLQIPRKELLAQYRQATEDGLSAANFVTTTDITVLQALIFYLAALRSLGEVAAVWSLAGLALRIAATIGITHDPPTPPTPTPSPFDRELRRRLWWALVYLDSRTAELVGQDGDRLLQRHDVRLPANLNDTQLFPSMQRLPESRPAATEMSYVLLRALLASHLNTVLGAPGPAGTWARIRSASVPMAEKASVVESLEQRLHEEVLRFCDPTVPLQAHTLNAAQTFLTKMRLVGNIPYDRSPATAGSGEGYSENLFQLSGKMMRLQLELFTDPSLRKWKWHWQGTFQWYALAELLRQTRLRVQTAPETTAAWLLVKRVLEEVVPQLGCDPEKCAILTAVQALFQTAMRHREQGGGAPVSDVRSSGQADGHEVSAGAAQAGGDGRQSSHARQMNGFSRGLGHGARPFSALLPAMDCMRASASSVLEAESGHGQAASSVAGGGVDEVGGMALDFAAVDWEEFDRLAGELSAS
ncbi:hypothetical protein LTR53_012153 [Teratosphaeriaceae sp. CCFEE 6253]|nr:hypothetical protein LTR53_012153 [Teratosphaeriaceae sp. CCFEE 6253]